MRRSISARWASQHGLLRCARNDGFGLMQMFLRACLHLGILEVHAYFYVLA
jgi:hypothetical protein